MKCHFSILSMSCSWPWAGSLTGYWQLEPAEPKSHVGRADTPWSSTRYYLLHLGSSSYDSLSLFFIFSVPIHFLVHWFQFIWFTFLCPSRSLDPQSSPIFIVKHEKDFNPFTTFIWECCDRGNFHFSIVPMGQIFKGQELFDWKCYTKQT